MEHTSPLDDHIHTLINSILIFLMFGEVLAIIFAKTLITNPDKLYLWIMTAAISLLIIVFMYGINFFHHHNFAKISIVTENIIFFYIRSFMIPIKMYGLYTSIILLTFILTILLFDIRGRIVSYFTVIGLLVTLPLFESRVNFSESILPTLSIHLIIGGFLIIVVHNQYYIDNLKSEPLIAEKNKYKFLFENIPVSVWEEDLTELVSYIDSLKVDPGISFEDWIVNREDVVHTALNKVVINDLNKATLDSFKATSKELFIQEFAQILNDESIENFIAQLCAIYNRVDFLTFKSRPYDLNNQLHEMEIYWSLYRYQNQIKTVALVFGIDVTTRLFAEKQLEEKDEQLIQSQKMESLGQLAGGIAHDFNNILTVILGHSEFLLSKKHEFSNDVRQSIIEINDAGMNVSAVVQQLLTFSRKRSVKIEPIDLNNSIRDISNMLLKLIGNKVDLITNLDPRIKLIEANKSQINLLLLNLVLNGRDAINSDGEVEISTEPIKDTIIYSYEGEKLYLDNFVCLKVRDNGSGIENNLLSQVFEPFFTTKKEGEGTGLGLATVYGTVRQSNGYLKVESVVNEGTTFSIYFPIKNNEL